MALAVSVRFDFQDQKGKTSFTKVRVPNGFSIAQYTEFAQAMGQLFANLSSARVTGASFCVGLDLSGSTIKAVASGISDIAQKALIGFSTIVAGFRTKLKLPAFSETKVISGSDDIDQSDVDVAAFLTAMENGIVVTGGTVSPTDIRENDVVSTDYSREYFRKK
jgi:hypothetical protein